MDPFFAKNLSHAVFRFREKCEKLCSTTHDSKDDSYDNDSKKNDSRAHDSKDYSNDTKKNDSKDASKTTSNRNTKKRPSHYRIRRIQILPTMTHTSNDTKFPSCNIGARVQHERTRVRPSKPKPHILYNFSKFDKLFNHINYYEDKLTNDGTKLVVPIPKLKYC